MLFRSEMQVRKPHLGCLELSRLLSWSVKEKKGREPAVFAQLMSEIVISHPLTVAWSMSSHASSA